ncbi:MAG: Eco57I restriction-modification methylase domain-containing protein [Truepera sp.]|nr:Eco57I restriction-modification methylase domain-containing protein [Truepera sp.]
MSDLRESLRVALEDFGRRPLKDAALSLWSALGYRSDRTLDMAFSELPPAPLAPLAPHVRRFDLLFQLTTGELPLAGQTSLGVGRYENQILESYVFAAVELEAKPYTRTELATFARALNRAFPMPVMVTFKHGDLLTVAAVQRRVNRRDDAKDVLEKVTLIRDIRFQSPHRAHLDILADLALARLAEKKPLTHFAELDRAWRRVLDSNELNKRFFRELANWFYWAAEHSGVSFPDVRDEPKPAEKRRKQHLQLIRLLTRLIFVWFLREKQLVPDKLFEEARLKALLKDFDPQGEGSSYYQAILQNLFFATLNTDMGDGRRFKDDAPSRYNAGYMVHTLYRYKSMFTDPDAALKLFASVPFLNGGLFECLDRERDEAQNTPEVRIDGFSDRPNHRANVPNALFFARPTRADLNAAYGTKGKRYEVRGLLSILSSYKFTITENTPIEEEVALDPELLGKVFENLLAAHNPETEESARKETGSFYTPRDVVDFMVDESLLAYLTEKLGAGDDLSSRLRALLEYQSTAPAFTDDERARLIAALDGCTTLDPACGSGAFPLGVLQKLVHVLSQLDPGGAQWKEQQEARLEAEVRADPEVRALKLDLETIRGIQLAEARNKAEAEVLERLKERVQTLQDAFDPYLTEPDYARKLYLIENCIFGVDIQPIAVQIAKLRCFISLIVDQKVNDSRPNRGILPLPNLETKFVAANALYPLPEAQGIKPLEVYAKEQELERIRHQHFKARKFSDKKRLRKRDADTRREIAAILKEHGFDTKVADEMANFDPYNQNASAPFFDPAWMFGLTGGFGVVIGNPPYIRQEKFKDDKPALKRHYDGPNTGVYTGTADLFVYFFRRGVDLLKFGGVLAYICSNKYFRSGYGKLLRDYLARQTRIRLLIDFGDAPVFTAIAYPSILLTQKALPNGNAMRVLSWNPKADIETFRDTFEAESFAMPQRVLTPDGWRIERPAVLKLLETLRQAGTPLGEYVNGRFYYGIKTGFNEAFVVGRAVRDALIQQDPKSAEVLKPFLRGRDVKRWRVDFAEQYLIKIESSENKTHPWSNKPDAEAERIFRDTYPAIHAFMQQYREQLIKRYDQGKYFWELRSCDYWQEFEQPKIVYPNICLRNEFAWDDQAYFSNQKTFIIPRAPKYLIGILNSQVVNWLFQQLLPKLQNGYFEPSAIYLTKFPIPNAPPPTQALVTRLVDYLLLSAQPPAGSQAALMVPFFEQLLDALVFELYLPDVLHGAGRRPFETLSAVAWPESPGVEGLRALYTRLYDPQHPARKLVLCLDSIPEVRLILQGARQAVVGAVVNDDDE